MPGNYEAGVFEQCQGDDAYVPFSFICCFLILIWARGVIL